MVMDLKFRNELMQLLPAETGCGGKSDTFEYRAGM